MAGGGWGGSQQTGTICLDAESNLEKKEKKVEGNSERRGRIREHVSRKSTHAQQTSPPRALRNTCRFSDFLPEVQMVALLSRFA